jgi:hypothetical protein
VYHTIKATLPSTNTHKDGYANSFIYSNAQFCMISNHLAIFLTVGVTWWSALWLVEGMGFGPQGQGDV